MNKNKKVDKIRAALNELGTSARTREVIEYLRSKGTVDVTPQQVSNEKARCFRLAKEAVQDLPASVLKRVKILVDELGSTAAVRKALDELDVLMTKGR